MFDARSFIYALNQKLFLINSVRCISSEKSQIIVLSTVFCIVVDNYININHVVFPLLNCPFAHTECSFWLDLYIDLWYTHLDLYISTNWISAKIKQIRWSLSFSCFMLFLILLFLLPRVLRKLYVWYLWRRTSMWTVITVR